MPTVFTPFAIGSVAITGPAVLAPLAGIGNLAFRLLCRRFGAAAVYTEMMSCHGILRGQPNTLRMTATDPAEVPVAFQLFGADPEAMAAASVRLAELGATWVDLNFGCPVPKVVRHNGGSALLREPALLQRITAAVVRACPRPVTAKIRVGWDEDRINAVEIARRIEDAGAAAVAVHGRTRAQRFGGAANWERIAEVVRAVRIPVIGNGDIADGADAARMFAVTGCAAVMVGRAALGRPWVFDRLRRFLADGTEVPEPDAAERIRVLREHHAGLRALKGERTARLEMRKHAAWYLRGLRGNAEARRRINQAPDEASFLALLDAITQGGLLDKA